ncbi:UDP-4-keto-6-deoxy-N-acetylglucosamine 4-aminotransferase [Oleiphilus messinensis]|uniref:UDP-4-keto-6-deoxy-N-acetylglucosamine 4-aminotransferase n=1 Tax=Oleiphilus messinensis TaxID=141451 RepID=A0A1Y0ICI3_9GAMM|nr:UDP-4-amino-4,6-dideoxy-N-acetyl-beta-L-altrosamine transaminase [Oleiphilus messinensis]ARU57175.1 UDP-4-keto-6-deoxy-N-acetylglucosamine 4-aminotransferase [Oleiphilus messinensis]
MTIPYSRHDVSEKDIDEVVAVLKSDFLTQGPVVSKFESQLAAYCNAKHAVATCNATAALHAACLAIEVKPEDRVWVAAVSFVASANCARYCGATVEFIDIDANTGLISIDNLSERLSLAKRHNCLPKALVVVHIAGQSCPMKEIYNLCKPLGVMLIEDASHALGGRYDGNRVGSCDYSDMCVFSFHPVKPITSGEGGMLVTNDEHIARRARLFISHGIERDPDRMVARSMPKWYYEQQALGYNYRLSDIHAALGASQLTRLDGFIKQRAELAHLYDELFADGAAQPLQRLDASDSAHHLYIIRLPDENQRDTVFDRLRASGYWVNLHYYPIPLQPYYQNLGAEVDDYPRARDYAQTALSLPLFHSMDQGNLYQVVDIVNSVLF